MSRASSTPFADWGVPETAAGWIARMQSRPLTSHEASAFRSWLGQDPAHRHEYEQYCRLNRLAHRIPEHADLLKDLPAYAALREPPAKTTSALHRWVTPLATAAVIVLSVVVIAYAVHHAPVTLFDNSYRTAHGEQTEVSLPDGSMARLNTDTTLNVAFSADERRVYLSRGEAYFEVEKERGGRPFVVYSRGTVVRVTGTRFNVRALEHGTDVVVSEGKVEVLPDPSRPSPSLPAKVELVPGNALEFDRVEQRVRIAAVDPERATSWRSGTIDFDNATLESVIDEVNRYSMVPFAIADDHIRSVRLSGTFKVGDVDSVRFALRDGFGIEATARDDRLELRGTR